ncbi:MAG TPA: hypothetical protein VFP39_09055 [Gemmatimonadales bacterium]|nr:hypothetical protein [Gemmatimonadales bacterium]
MGGRQNLLRWYYLCTPVFWLLDVVWGVHVRVAFLDDLPLLRNVYYAACCGIGIAATVAPRYTARLALTESAVNLGLLVLSVGLWYLSMLDWAASETVAVRVVTPWQLVNFVFTLAAAVVSYGLRAEALT